MLIFELANKLYYYNAPLYKSLYFLYKKYSEKDKVDIIKKILKKDMAVVDVGANIGFYSLLFANIVGANGKVFSFEPDEKNYNLLKNNTLSCPNIFIEKMAISDKSEEINLYISDKLNVDHQTYDNGEGRKRCNVKATSLDNYFSLPGQIDLVKIDVQGYEMAVLKGMEKIIKRQKKIIIISELWPFGLQKAGSNFDEYLKLLDHWNFKVRFFKKIENLRSKENDKNYYTDFIATKG